jgi:hypothetical protein
LPAPAAGLTGSGSGLGTVVPDWGGKDLKHGTVRAIVRQLGIDWKIFEQA